MERFCNHNSVFPLRPYDVAARRMQNKNRQRPIEFLNSPIFAEMESNYASSKLGLINPRTVNYLSGYPDGFVQVPGRLCLGLQLGWKLHVRLQAHLYGSI